MKKGAISLFGSMLLMLSAVGCNSGSNDKEITFWHCIGHDKMRNLERIIDKFNEEHASTDGYKIVQEKLAGAYDDLHDAVKTKLQAGYVPSITMGYPDSFSEYIGTKGEDNSQILKLDSFISSDSTFNKDEFVPGYYNEGTGYQYSGTWSMPLYKSTEAMYINKQMFEGTTLYKNHKNDTYGNYGAKIGDPSTWDWDTLVYVASEVQKEKNPDGKADFHALGYDSDSNLFISQMAMRNIPYTSAEGTGSKHFLFCDDNGNPNADLVKFAAEILDLTNSGTLVTQGSYGSYASDLFLSKKTMITIGSTGGSSYNDPHGSTDGGFDCALYSVPCYQNNYMYIMQGPSLCFFNTKDTKKEKVAWEFYSKFVSDAELNAALALENSYDPIKTSSYETSAYKEWTSLGKTAEGDDNVEAKLEYRIPNLTAKIKDKYITSPVFNGSAKARSEIGSILSYAKASSAATSEEKVSAAIVKAFTNCVNSIRGSGN